MTEFATPEGLEHVDYYKSRRDNRVVAIHIHAGFDEFEAFPPFMESEEAVSYTHLTLPTKA